MKTNTIKEDLDMTYIRLNGTTDQHIDALDWLEHNISKGAWNFVPNWPSNCITYNFQRPEDAMIFRLRWKP